MSLKSYYESMHPLFGVLDLDCIQMKTLWEWMEKLPPCPPEETCTTCQHPFSVTYYMTGIGEVFYVHTNINDEEYSCHLEYDDDGKIVGAVK